MLRGGRVRGDAGDGSGPLHYPQLGSVLVEFFAQVFGMVRMGSGDRQWERRSIATGWWFRRAGVSERRQHEAGSGNLQHLPQRGEKPKKGRRTKAH